MVVGTAISRCVGALVGGGVWHCLRGQTGGVGPSRLCNVTLEEQVRVANLSHSVGVPPRPSLNRLTVALGIQCVCCTGMELSPRYPEFGLRNSRFVSGTHFRSDCSVVI